LRYEELIPSFDFERPFCGAKTVTGRSLRFIARFQQSNGMRDGLRPPLVAVELARLVRHRAKDGTVTDQVRLFLNVHDQGLSSRSRLRQFGISSYPEAIASACAAVAALSLKA
jgi:hypothetical protein